MADARDIYGGAATACGTWALCKVCNVSLSSRRIKQHFEEDDDHWQACEDASADSFVCFECGVWCQSQKTLDEHLAGWAHSKRIEWLGGDGAAAYGHHSGGGDGDDDDYSDSEASWSEEDDEMTSAERPAPGHMLCKLCNFSSSRTDMFYHLHSAAHREVASGDWGARIACIECGLLCSSQHNHIQHLNGVMHQARRRWLYENGPSGNQIGGPTGQFATGNRSCPAAGPAGAVMSYPTRAWPASQGAGANASLGAHLLKELEQLLTCPVSHDIMRNPVIAQDGHSYEKSAIDQWFRQHSTSPVTGAAVGDPRVQVPNRGMRAVAALYHRYMALALQTEHTLP